MIGRATVRVWCLMAGLFSQWPSLSPLANSELHKADFEWRYRVTRFRQLSEYNRVWSPEPVVVAEYLRRLKSTQGRTTSGNRSGELRTKKLKSHLLWTRNLKFLPLKPGVGQYIAIHPTPTARDSSLLISTHPVHLPAFFQNLSRVFPVLAVANTGFCVGPQNKIGPPAHRYRQLMQFTELSAHGIELGSNTCAIVFLSLHSENVDIFWVVVWKRKTCCKMTSGMNNYERDWFCFQPLYHL